MDEKREDNPSREKSSKTCLLMFMQHSSAIATVAANAEDKDTTEFVERDSRIACRFGRRSCCWSWRGTE